jgi:hypothetical protein
MQRAVPALFVALVLAAVGFLFAHGRLASTAPELAAAQPTASPTVVASGSGSDAPSERPDAGVTAPPKSEIEKVLGGGPIPSLPNDAPSKVDIGVILFTHDEAQLAGKHARSRKEALRLAREIVPQARENFTEAVKHGDPGSTDDAGTVPRGVLEPPLQYLVYTLEKGQVFPEPVDTPRGYWVVKRTR